jgi:dihydroxyacetone kinase
VGLLEPILSIFFDAFAFSLASSTTLAQAASQALASLQTHTPARVGHRTIMNVLIPACKTLEATGNLKEAVASARIGTESTKRLKPVSRRATCVGGFEEKEGCRPSDPGAWCAYEAIRGLWEGLVGA